MSNVNEKGIDQNSNSELAVERLVSPLGQQVERLQKDYDSADYILGEVHSYIIIHRTEIEKEFYDWFIKKIARYKEGG